MLEHDAWALRVSTRLFMSTIQMLTQLQHIMDDACLPEHLLHSALALTSTLLGEDPHAQQVQVHLVLQMALAVLTLQHASVCCSAKFLLLLLSSLICRSSQQSTVSSEHCTQQLTHSTIDTIACVCY